MKLNLKNCAFGVSSGKFFGFMVSHRRIEEILIRFKQYWI